MRALIVLAGVLVAVLVAALWLSGGFEVIARLAAEAQRGFQTDMARSLRALKGGETAAVLGLLALSFGYGVAHAAGPGHGKFLIGGYGLGRRVGVGRLATIALVSSLAQAVTAILFVAVAFAMLGWARERVTDLADRTLEPLSYGLIGLIGLWLALRGLRHLAAQGRGGQGHHHGHGHHHHEHVHGPDCDHAHLPDADAIARAQGWRELAMLVGAVAIRPCTGALFVLVLTFAMGIPLAGIAAAFAMALGTAIITIAVAAGAVSMREGLFASLAGSPALALAVPLAEIVAGGLVVTLAAMLIIRTV
ncbi:MAG: hypothetical protein RLZZ528_703 [Pseudomonadota bacterium]